MKRRRRGADLEEAILEATAQELAAGGYDGLTMVGVANRAGTSRSVIARRWTGKPELVVAALQNELRKNPVAVPDRGDLRTELLELLDQLSNRATGIAAVFTLFTGAYFRETRTTPADLRAALGGTDKATLLTILDRAAARGEIDEKRLIPPISTLLNDLFRHHIIMTFSPPPKDLRESWVDSIFLPLVKSG